MDMTLKNAVTKGVKAWRDRRVGHHLDTSAYIIERSEWVLCHGLQGAGTRLCVREGKVFGNVIEECLDSLNFTKMVFVYDIGKSRWQADFGREALEFGRDHFTIDTGNYLITVDPKRYRIFDRAAGKPLVNGVVRIDEQYMKDILAAAPKSQRGWIRTRLGYMVVP